jgi:hypothetical protein
MEKRLSYTAPGKTKPGGTNSKEKPTTALYAALKRFGKVNF